MLDTLLFYGGRKYNPNHVVGNQLIYLQLLPWIWVLTPKNVFVLSSLADRCGAVQPCCQPFIEGERDIWADVTEQDGHGLLSASPGPTCFRHHCGLPPFAVFYLRNSRENLKISERFSARKYWYHGKLINYGENWCGSFCFGIPHRKRKRIIATQGMLPVHLTIRLGKWTWA